jgi:PKD repeat protein
MGSRLLLGFVVCLFIGLPLAALPPDFVEERVGGAWSEAVGLTFAADGRLFLWERGGRVWWIGADGHEHTEPFIDISDEVGAWRDHGLLGFALHPDFLQNGHVYLFYVVDRHHLFNSGLPSYDPNANQYFAATIGRITRYTARASDGLHTVDPASRLVLVGESPTTGFPIVDVSHGVGTLVFGTDGTLLASCGDAGNPGVLDIGGPSTGTYVPQALTDGILRTKEDIGAYRAQLVDCLNGKVIRIDPATGDGVATNPFFQPAAPRSARSRVWALGLRNPFRMALRPGTGSHDPADGDPGVLYIGDVGWRDWEDLHVVAAPGANCGWPVFEGLEPQPSYSVALVANRDAPNPRFGVSGCTQQHFYFTDLIVQETPDGSGSFPNPCGGGAITSVERFVHSRPALDWGHATGPARTGVFVAGVAAVIDVGAAGSPVSGVQFAGNCSVGGAWYTGGTYPPEYAGTYFHADFGEQWIKNLVPGANGRPAVVRDFETGGEIVALATHPLEGDLHYVSWTSEVWRIRYAPGGNRAPSAVASSDVSYGASPLAVAFTGSGSVDPDGGPLTYEWDFGDGSSPSTQADPVHVYTAPPGVPTSYQARLSVTDAGGAAAQATLLISVNNTPPDVTITSPEAGTLYPLSGETTYALEAEVSDAQHSAANLICRWEVVLHHNSHTHAEPPDASCTSTAVTSPLGCDGETYFYRIRLTVTDAAGLAGVDELTLYPDCGNRAPSAVALADASYGASPLAVAFQGSTSTDPDGGPLTYEWDFGDGSSPSAEADPLHVYTAPPGVPTSYQARLRVTDAGGAAAEATLLISVNNTPPQVTITSPGAGATFSVYADTPYTYEADIMDAEHDASEITCRWETVLHRGPASYLLGVDGSCEAARVLSPLSPVSCDPAYYYYRIVLTATDAAGLSTVREAVVRPQCFAAPPSGTAFVLDDGDPGTSFNDIWTRSTSSGALNGDYLFTREADRFYRYTFSLPYASVSQYDVYLWWKSGSGRYPNVPVDIEHHAGTSTVEVNQQGNGGKWNRLGTYGFGSSARITIRSRGTAATTCADGVRLVALGGAVNMPPAAQITGIAPNPAAEGSAVSFTGSGSDPDGTVVGYEWTSDLAGLLSTQAAFETQSLAAGIHTVSFRVRDDFGSWSAPAVALLEVVESEPPPPPSLPEIIVDNGGAGTSSVGTWKVSAASGWYGVDSLYAAKTAVGARYTYTASTGAGATYEVFLWWTSGSSREQSVPVDVQHAGGTSRVTVNQQLNGGRWNSIGTYTFGAAATITIISLGQGWQTCADAVRLVPLGGAVNTPPAAQITGISPNPAAEGSAVSFTGSGSDPDGTVVGYEWTSDLAGLLSTQAAFETQSLAAGIHTVSFRVRDDAGSWSAPAVALLEVVGEGPPPPPSLPEIIVDNGAAGTSSVGDWRVSSASGWYGVDSLYAAKTAVGWTYTYTASTGAGATYEVFLWWTSGSGREQNVPVDVQHAGGTSRVTVNQRLNGGRWNSIGTYTFGATATITINSLGQGWQTCADALRLVPTGS